VAFKSLPKSVQPLIFEMHKYYLTTLRPNQKSLHLIEVITWITEYLKAQYSVSNMLRFMKETELPPISKALPKDDLATQVGTAVAPNSPVADESDV